MDFPPEVNVFLKFTAVEKRSIYRDEIVADHSITIVRKKHKLWVINIPGYPENQDCLDTKVKSISTRLAKSTPVSFSSISSSS